MELKLYVFDIKIPSKYAMFIFCLVLFAAMRVCFINKDDVREQLGIK